MDDLNIRAVLLQVVTEMSDSGPGMFQEKPVLTEIYNRLGRQGGRTTQQAILTAWHDLFRTGHLAWGYDLNNPDPPFCHVTERGRQALAHFSRDPSNPDGYLRELHRYPINEIAKSYIREAVATYNNSCFKATAVMVGTAAEAIVLEVRDELVARMQGGGKRPSDKLRDWKIASVSEAVRRELEPRRKSMTDSVADGLAAYWPAFLYQIRQIRNDAGHPNRMDPVTEESVHAALLMFPGAARFASALIEWIKTAYDPLT